MTIYDIAKEAGVSASTVSRVINGKPGIKEATRRRVQKLLDENEYIPNAAARGLVKQASRFIGILIEHFAGAFPTWLAPVQVKVLPISDKFMDYAKQVTEKLEEAGIRTELDMRSEKIGYKIREAQMQKIPYMLVVGQKEEEEGLVAVRSRFLGDEGQKTLEEFIVAIKDEIAKKEIREVQIKK